MLRSPSSSPSSSSTSTSYSARVVITDAPPGRTVSPLVIFSPAGRVSVRSEESSPGRTVPTVPPDVAYQTRPSKAGMSPVTASPSGTPAERSASTSTVIRQAPSPAALGRDREEAKVAVGHPHAVSVVEVAVDATEQGPLGQLHLGQDIGGVGVEELDRRRERGERVRAEVGGAERHRHPVEAD